MSNKKRKADAKKRKKRAKERKRQQAQERVGQSVQSRIGSIIDARRVEPDILGEVRHITELAQAGDARIVMLNSLVFFSTETQDAWLLDAEDNLALCLVRGGQEQPYRIIDTPTTFGIDWNAEFEISEELFTVIDRAGRVTSIAGYPTAQIAAACEGRVV
jgi:hypothetical protein